jgi:hypothetical protein
VVALTWFQGERGRPIVSWAGPPEYRRAVLCDIGSTPIEELLEQLNAIPGSARCSWTASGRGGTSKLFESRTPKKS